MSSTGERNARRGSRPTHGGRAAGMASHDWIWGRHAVQAALANPRRPLRMLLATPDRSREFAALIAVRDNADAFEQKIVSADHIARELPAGATHQGCALRVGPLEEVGLADLAPNVSDVLVVLDQVTDPQNVGAIIRSAAAFGARAVVVQDRRAPPLSGAVARAAAGAIERVPVVQVVNLARALDELSDLGWRAIGLAGEAPQSVEEVLDERPVALVLGSEGEGLRRLVAEHCDALARIAMPGGGQSLNVSVAAAVALYATRRRF